MDNGQFRSRSRAQGGANRKIGTKAFRVLLLASISLVIAVVLMLITGHITQVLPGEQAAQRWRGVGDGNFAQVSAFFPRYRTLTASDITAMTSSMRHTLDTDGFSPDEGDFAYAYSGEGVLTLSTARGEVEARAFGIGGNFFLFHPVRLISGAGWDDSSINRDIVLLSESAAWDLFGALDIAGQTLMLDGQTLVVAGVYRPYGDFATQAALDVLPHIFLPYEMLSQHETAPVTALYVIAPNPLSHFAAGLVQDVVEERDFEEGTYHLMENSARYRLGARFSIAGQFGRRSMQQMGLQLPPWENSARMTEDYVALLLIFTLFFLILPLLATVVILFRIGRHLKQKAKRSIEKRRLPS